MLELYKKRLKNNKGTVFLLIFYATLLFWCVWSLIQQCIDNPFALRSVVYLLFIAMSIGKIVIAWRRFSSVEIRAEEEEGTIQNISWKEWQQAILRNDLAQLPSGVIAVFIISIPIVIVFAVIIFKNEIFTASYISNPSYDFLNDYSNIFLAIAFIVKDIPELLNIEQKALNKISNLLFILSIFASLSLNVSYANHLTEVTF